MNSQVAGYYRAVLFADGQDQQALPKSLLRLHGFAEKRHHALGLGSTITKATALAVALTWLANTVEGREFSKGLEIKDLFVGDDDDDDLDVDGDDDSDFPESAGIGKIDWAKVSPETPVVISANGSTISGTFIKRRHSWIDVKVDGVDKHFPIKQVRLAQGQLAGV